MNVWLVVDDCPQDFGKVEVIEVFASRQLAERYVAVAKTREMAYERQYWTIERRKVHSTTVKP